MLLRYSLGLESEARAIEVAVESALDASVRTADIARPGQAPVGSEAATLAVLGRISTD